MGYHTIYIATGTYNPGEEESFTLCPTNGVAGDGIVSFYTTYRTAALIQIPRTNNLIGLCLIGAGKDSTIIDAQQAGNSNRVMYIMADNVYLKNIWLKGGKFVQWGPVVNWAGVGILIHGDYVLLENVKVSGCYQDGHRNIGVNCQFFR